MTTDEFFDKYEATRLLVENLKTNLDAVTNLSKEQKEILMRVNLIMIKQCLRDCGVE